jgi:hypothetical protein
MDFPDINNTITVSIILPYLFELEMHPLFREAENLIEIFSL